MSIIFKTSNKFNNFDICNLKKESFKKEFGGGEIFITNIDNHKYVIKVIPYINNKRENVEYKKIIKLYEIDKKYLLFFSNIYQIKECNNYRYYLMDYYDNVLENFLKHNKFKYVQYISIFKQLLIALYILNNIVKLYHNDIFKPVDGIDKIKTSNWNIKNVLLDNIGVKKYYFFDKNIIIKDYLIKIIDFGTLNNKMKFSTRRLKNLYFEDLEYITEVFLCTFVLLSRNNSLIDSKNILINIYNNITNNYIINSQKTFDEIFIRLIMNI